MQLKVDGWNNFCRVFELPKQYPQGFCFGGGKPSIFLMIDWFNPIPDLPVPAIPKEEWPGEIEIKELSMEELYETIVPWLLKKQYIKKGQKYLVICDFGAAITFEKHME